MDMTGLLKEIYPLKLAPNSPDTDRAVEILKRELAFTVHEFKSGEELNGWIVPKSWEATKAEIRKNGKLIYDGKKHPLGVMGYSKPFRGRVPLDELKKHLTCRKDKPDAIGYHCDYYYKPHLADWGFSVPYTLYRKLGEGEYDVALDISYAEGPMKVCDFFLPGRRKDTIVFNAHNCHAAQANDDISGVVAGVELMKRLSGKKNKYSYRLIVAPEHLGTVFYLGRLKKKSMDQFKFCFFLEMLGNDNRIALQESFTGERLIDMASRHYLKTHFPDHITDKFRKIVGNDETVWEAPGYEIPTVSVSRSPYPEYHTSMDNEGIVKEEKLTESVGMLLGIINIMETNCAIKRKFRGFIALSSPKYDLYISPGTDPSVRVERTEERKKWNYMMDCLPRYFDGKMTILDIAVKHDIPYEELYGYLRKFEEKGLIEMIAGGKE